MSKTQVETILKSLAEKDCLETNRLASTAKSGQESGEKRAREPTNWATITVNYCDSEPHSAIKAISAVCNRQSSGVAPGFDTTYRTAETCCCHVAYFYYSLST